MAFTGISYGNQLTPEAFATFKSLLLDLRSAKGCGLSQKERARILDQKLPQVVSFRKHVGDLTFTHWVSVHWCAPNSHVALYVLPLWCPPIFHRAEMLPALLEIVQLSLGAGEFIYDIEKL